MILQIDKHRMTNEGRGVSKLYQYFIYRMQIRASFDSYSGKLCDSKWQSGHGFVQGGSVVRIGFFEGFFLFVSNKSLWFLGSIKM